MGLVDVRHRGYCSDWRETTSTGAQVPPSQSKTKVDPDKPPVFEEPRVLDIREHSLYLL